YYVNQASFVGTVAAHEAGHGFELVHQRYTLSPPPVNNPNYPEYYPGDGLRAPIMGGAQGQAGVRDVWWRTNMEPGQQSPDPVQDDLAVLSGLFGYRPIDYTYANHLTMQPDGNGAIHGYGGTLERSTDFNPFGFVAIGTTASFTISEPPLGGMLGPSAVIKAS